MKLLQHLYFRYYQLMVDAGNGDIASFAGTLFMTLIFGVNILTFFEILDLLGVGVNTISVPIAGVVMVCVLGGIYFLLVFNGRSASIVSQFEGESKRNKLRGRIGLLAYILLSIALLISTWILMAAKNQR